MISNHGEGESGIDVAISLGESLCMITMTLVHSLPSARNLQLIGSKEFIIVVVVFGKCFAAKAWI